MCCMPPRWPPAGAPHSSPACLRQPSSKHHAESPSLCWSARKAPGCPGVRVQVGSLRGRRDALLGTAAEVELQAEQASWGPEGPPLSVLQGGLCLCDRAVCSLMAQVFH